MESQQVVDFVRKLITDGKTCSEICDALCDECLADSTDGDGTGCDNMTVICTTFQRRLRAKNINLKRLLAKFCKVSLCGEYAIP
uniref:PPM-type phosphatase domain-containing protein n=1 Tax=Caenorhabditis japonica TaxID=281687 RepID=A0A8R1IES5_CAEJA